MPQPGEQPGRPAVELRAPQRDAPLAVTASVHPADRARVATPVHRLEVATQPHRRVGRRATDGSRRVQRSGQLQRVGAVAQPAGHVAREVTDVGQLEDVGRGRHRQVGAVRRQQRGHRLDRVAVLLEVLGRPQQPGRAATRRPPRRHRGPRFRPAPGTAPRRRCAGRAAPVSRRRARPPRTSSSRGSGRPARAARTAASMSSSARATRSWASTTLSSAPDRIRGRPRPRRPAGRR